MKSMHVQWITFAWMVTDDDLGILVIVTKTVTFSANRCGLWPFQVRATSELRDNRYELFVF